ncbi:hypothetical protein QEH42_gp058 [Microbacterium phage Pumpernickel]|uniref:Uncharacterized protein n=1 Tax=Microbacterium phage Pumpernickel TaxID=2885983 RepID=A0AAE8Y712_9CAUD|nr:hypothetical protein QEH42_gp058 [Microbacterium phage Pumpernickel]UDL15849.1 hypothetical protein SEA_PUMPERNICKEL_58 [Microbacterium phage Pumpernickel]
MLSQVKPRTEVWFRSMSPRKTFEFVDFDGTPCLPNVVERAVEQLLGMDARLILDVQREEVRARLYAIRQYLQSSDTREVILTWRQETGIEIKTWVLDNDTWVIVDSEV